VARIRSWLRGVDAAVSFLTSLVGAIRFHMSVRRGSAALTVLPGHASLHGRWFGRLAPLSPGRSLGREMLGVEGDVGPP
jgi:hypothetical protein